MTIGTSGTRAMLTAAVVTLAGVASASAWAQNGPETAAIAAPANVLSLGEIESRLTAQGIKVEEIEVRDLLAEVEGYDAQGRPIELVIDRRNGQTLSHEYEDDRK